jgi:hypothetical protein
MSFKHAGNLLYILVLVLNALTVYAFMLALVRPGQVPITCRRRVDDVPISPLFASVFPQ